LYTSQPGVSKQIKELEEELGVQIFERRGKRFVGLTEPGKAVLEIIERVLNEAENLKRVGSDYADRDSGSLVIATTHTQARYALPRVVSEFRKRYPRVHLSLLQGSPKQIAQMVSRNDAHIGIASESLSLYPELLAMPGYQWHHVVVVREGHPLLKAGRLTLEALAEYPIITYSPEFTGRSQIDEAFTSRGLTFDIVLTAIDSDVIKTYVELDLGVGIIAAMAFDPERDRGLRAIDAGHLFRHSTTRIAIRRGAYLRSYTYDFIELFAPHLTREVIEQALEGGGESYEL
ncbi:MAG: CysB family HTH-type transcriptional regulator, partial [Burkholderiales bacterium]|nr:CysB family HTH-type transcriptional regulator [Burkholderiales bacterium]